MNRADKPGTLPGFPLKHRSREGRMMEEQKRLIEHIDYLIKTYDTYAGIEERKKQLAIIRLHCLYRNKQFISDCKKMRKLKKDNLPDFRIKEKEFFNKWDIDYRGISLSPENFVKVVHDGPIPILGKPLDEGFVVLKIDLLWPKNKILKRVERIIEQYRSQYKELLKDPFYLSSDEFKETKKRQKAVRNTEQVQDFELYQKYLLIWDLRQAGKSWNKIKTMLDESKFAVTISGIRRAFDKMDTIISEGLPGFKKFPAK